MDIETSKGCFDDADLVHLLARTNGNQIVLGRVNTTFRNHPKPYSLCYWLRQRFGGSNDRLLTGAVLAALRDTGRYQFGRVIDPVTGHPVQAIDLTEIAPTAR